MPEITQRVRTTKGKKKVSKLKYSIHTQLANRNNGRKWLFSNQFSSRTQTLTLTQYVNGYTFWNVNRWKLCCKTCSRLHAACDIFSFVCKFRKMWANDDVKIFHTFTVLFWLNSEIEKCDIIHLSFSPEEIVHQFRDWLILSGVDGWCSTFYNFTHLCITDVCVWVHKNGNENKKIMPFEPSYKVRSNFEPI